MDNLQPPKDCKILLVDNYDSFTYNLVELLRQCGVRHIKVAKNNKITLEEVGNYSHVIFSPGPALPKDAPIMREIIDAYDQRIPILGVCLGHQAIAEAYGGSLYNMKNVTHGQRSLITPSSETTLFQALPPQFYVGLYHSWSVVATGLPDVLRVTATDARGRVMALEHISLPVFGVQFHPESYMTEYGREMMLAFLSQGQG